MLSCNALFVLAGCCIRSSTAQPRIDFPINVQFPPIAVSDEVFNFTFSADTFSSLDSLSYTLVDAPHWLRIEDATRTLHGTPSSGDLGDALFVLEATDASGSASLNTKLVVLDRSSLRSDLDEFAEQIGRAGSYSAPSTLLLYPETAFKLEFGHEIFVDGDKDIYYYATSADHAPLPAWISFDASTVAFVGTTPSLLTPQSSPQIFTFTLVASEVPGYSQAIAEFQIAVTNHILAFDEPSKTLKVSAGAKVAIGPFSTELRRDGLLLDRSNISRCSSNQPDWLTFSIENLSFSGTSPSNLNDTNFELVVTDDEDNIATAELSLLVSQDKTQNTTEVFLDNVNAIIGQYFEYEYYDAGIFNSSNNITMDLDSADKWLSFTRSNLTLHGIVPAGTKQGRLNITLLSDNGQVVWSEYLTIVLISPSQSTTDSATPSATSAWTPTTTTSLPTYTAGGLSSAHRRSLALIVSLPLLAVLATSFILYIWWRKRQEPSTPPYLTTSMTTSPVSSPHRQESSWYSSSGNIVVQIGSQSRSEVSTERASTTPPPRVDFDWPPRSKTRDRLLRDRDEGNNDSPETRSSWEVMLLEVDGPLNRNAKAITNPSRPDIYLDHSEHTTQVRPTSNTTTPCPSNIMAGLTHNRKNLNTFGLGESHLARYEFNGRRSSGLGHGMLRESLPGVQQMTLRQVPLSPLSGAAGIYQEVLPPFAVRQDVNRKLSLVSSESKYAAPHDEEVLRQCASERNESSADPFSESGWEEDNDWVTERSTSSARKWLPRQHTGDLSLASDGPSSEYAAASQRVGMSKNMHSMSFSHGPSQSNSLRFI